ncbi:hypothetical protein Q0Z83_029930 [Actinoplanes sichuanensis]|uniref:Membrane transport protein MMPL domain-containing protein n=1 Tax=Actinoplanes sichuanensis TaxID=512349 RepID=A0ABW4AUR8_9ACTN|nr:hypothetical protein [Actinoplanes sichuanensis]BEL04802.1 hypothetical protein Q0Z83_029930 [Actinoplanes sichuanensis]
MLLAGFGSGSLAIAAIALLAPTLLVVILARRHAFPSRRPVSHQETEGSGR